MADIYIGITGMGLVLIAYAMNQTGRWDDDDVLFDAANLIGALLLVVYAFQIDGWEGWPFVILNAVWAAIAGRDLYERFFAKEKAAPAKEEPKPKEKQEPKEEEPELKVEETVEKEPEEELSERSP